MICLESKMIKMANLTSVITVKVPKDVKEEANKIFNNLGLNMSTAINMFLKRTISERGIPFELKEINNKPSKDLMEALHEGEDILNGKIKQKCYHNVDEMFNDILNDKI